MGSFTSSMKPGVVQGGLSNAIATASPNNALTQCTSCAISYVASSTPSPQLNKRNCVDLTCYRPCTTSSTRNYTQWLFLYWSPNMVVPKSTSLHHITLIKVGQLKEHIKTVDKI